MTFVFSPSILKPHCYQLLVPRVILVNSFNFLYRYSCNKYSFISSCPNCISFTCFSCPLVLDRTLVQCQKAVVKRDMFTLFPMLVKKLQVSHHLYAYSDYLFLLMCVLADSILQGIGSYHLGYRICDYKVVHSPYYHLNVHGICKDACNLCFLSIFIFHSLTTGLSIFF